TRRSSDLRHGPRHVLARNLRAGRKQREVAVREIEIRQLLHRIAAPAEAHAAAEGSVARERVQLRHREAALFEDRDYRFADQTGGADHGNSELSRSEEHTSELQ